MPLTTSTRLLKEAVAARKTIVAFNMFNAESIAAAVRAAESAGVPVILAVTEPDMGHIGCEEVAALVRVHAAKTSVPVVLHLDHGESLRTVVLCLRAGFTSIMIDASHLPEEQGHARVRTIVEICHHAGVPVESLAGKLRSVFAEAGGEGSEEELTDPGHAATFVQQTGVDSLAVSLGTVHGGYLLGMKATLDMDRLREIARRVTVPLVVHGGSAGDP
jgi:ketose-bisphosphate aldolase